MSRSQAQLRYGIFVNDDASEAMSHTRDVGAANEHVHHLQDTLMEGSLADLDPLNQLIMMEEMDEWEARVLIEDIYRKLKGSK